MAGAHVQTKTAGASNATSCTTPSATTTSGNLLVAGAAGYRSASPQANTITDSKSNTWTGNPSNPQTPSGNNVRGEQVYSQNITGGSSHTFTNTTASATYQTLFVSEFSGMATTSVLDKSAGNIGSSTTPSSGTTATRTQADEILVANCFTGDNTNGTAPTAGTGFTIPTNGSNGSFNNEVSAIEYQIVSATGTDAGTFTIANDSWGCIIGTYKVAASASPQTVTLSSVGPDFAAGTAKVNESVAMTGVASVFAAGTLKVNENLALSGVASAFAAGTLKVNQTISLSGVASAFAAGTQVLSLGPAPQTVTLSGVASVFASGTLKINESVALAGVASAFASGTLKANRNINLTGVASAFAVGLFFVDGGVQPDVSHYRKLINSNDTDHVDTVLH